MDFTELFCDVDDFCREFEPVWCQRQIALDRRRRQRRQQLSFSERMTIIIAFHASGYRDFKHFYLMLRLRHRADFPGRFSRLGQLYPLCAVDAVSRGSAICVAANMLRQGHRHRVR